MTLFADGHGMHGSWELEFGGRIHLIYGDRVVFSHVNGSAISLTSINHLFPIQNVFIINPHYIINQLNDRFNNKIMIFIITKGEYYYK